MKKKKNPSIRGIFPFYMSVCIGPQQICIFDDCREITSSRGCTAIFLIHIPINFFFFISCAVHSEVLLIYLFRWWLFFYTSSMSFIAKMHTQNWKSIGCYIQMEDVWKRTKKKRNFSLPEQKKKCFANTHIHQLEYALSCVCFYLLNGIGILHSISGYCEIKIFFYVLFFFIFLYLFISFTFRLESERWIHGHLILVFLL